MRAPEKVVAVLVILIAGFAGAARAQEGEALVVRNDLAPR